MGMTMPQRPQRYRKPQYDYPEGFYTGFGIFMTCAIILFIAAMVFLCVKFG